MIQKFSVENFRGFKSKIVFDLTNTHDYAFHREAVQDGISKKSLIFGKNGSGKSNLGLAMIDIARHLTSNFASRTGFTINQYMYAGNMIMPTTFYYKFKFDKDEVEYYYRKVNPTVLVFERLTVNGKIYLECDYLLKKYSLFIPGSDKLDMTQFDYKMSLTLFVYSRAGYEKNDVFYKFYDFVSRMLFFRSLRSNEFEGYSEKPQTFAEILIQHSDEKALEGLQSFLHECGIDYDLDICKDPQTGRDEIFAKFDKNKVILTSIWSTGTSALVLFYCWLLELNKVSFLYVDEFDAFYHYELSEKILNLINKSNCQSIVTSHNCALMSNKLTRPDCCFIITGNEIIKNLTQCTDREIREGHNLENLYKNGAFCD